MVREFQWSGGLECSSLMHTVLKFGIYALEALFACGLFGSLLVILLSMVDDLEVFVSSGHKSEAHIDEAENQNVTGLPHSALSH
jgi:hypothetical protein